jgi:nucleoside-diphosphate-sugar epimerase
VLLVGAASFAEHTAHMAINAPTTTFVTGTAGFIGSELVKVLVARRLRVFGLTDSMQAAERLRPRPATA